MTRASSSATSASRPVIMVRGFLATIQLMKPVFQALADQGFEMMTLDPKVHQHIAEALQTER